MRIGDRFRSSMLLLAGCFLVLAVHPLQAQSDARPGPEVNPLPRRIVLCLDGTWNSTYAEKHRDDGSKVVKPTNVLKLCRSALQQDPVDKRAQLVYYHTGVGSLAKYPGTSNWLLHRADKLLGGAFGAGFEANIEDALNFLVLNYQEGDQVFIFGFSRGAATARGLTNFLEWSQGLPIKEDAFYLPQFFRTFVTSKGGRSSADVLKEINAKRNGEGKPSLGSFQSIDVEYLGVWDTVMALGARFQAKGASTSAVSKSFYIDRQPARCVRHARQALALDEARYDFRPEIWMDHAEGQTLEQRWFAGVHSNVGGGYVNDGLANLAFHWILEGATAQGLAVDKDFVKFYRSFPQDRLYRSESTLYRVLDGLRWRFGRGKRPLAGQPAAANLSLDRSVIHRIVADGNNPRFELKGRDYRPENVLLFLACQPDLDGYLQGLDLTEKQRQLPPDVMKRIGELRHQCVRQAEAAR
ncbi:MAG TPA: DUF2235 domain-containing protein [Thermoanaerobaculia bacterium]|nr:DUF2235 domain-containing protein [Thermoanaerobaculia bacterium]